MDFKSMIGLVTEARAQGAKALSATVTEWDVSGRCEAPVPVELHVRPPKRWLPARSPVDRASANQIVRQVMEAFPGAKVSSTTAHVWREAGWEKYRTIKPGEAHSLTMLMHVKCRKCKRCLAARRREWQYRAEAETNFHPRTWFGTLTLNPDEHHVALSRARLRLRKQGVDFDTLSVAEQFGLRLREIAPLLTLWLKRIRKNSTTKLRYVLVTEAHKSGLPHFHILVHECSASGHVTKRTLQAQWTHGFTSFKLVDDARSAGYVCKYLQKSHNARVRASGSYGTVLHHSVSVKEPRPSATF